MTERYKFGWVPTPEMQSFFDAADAWREAMYQKELRQVRIEGVLLFVVWLCYALTLFIPLIARMK